MSLGELAVMERGIEVGRLSGAPGDERPRRILFVITSSDVGGTETCLRELVCRLDRREFEPVVCSLRPPGRTASEIAATGTRVVSAGMSERPRIGELVAGVMKLARWMDELDVDLVQAFLYRANTLAGLAARLARRRPVVVAGQRSLYPMGGRRAAFAARWTRHLSDRVVAVSAAVRHQLMETERLEADRVVVIDNGVDTARYEMSDDRPGRPAFGLRPDAIAVGAVGRLSVEKGFHHLVEGVSLARGRGCPLSLLVAGDGPERSRLEQQAQSLQLDGDATFLGMRRDLPALYAAVDIFALPSLEEGSPNALLEAMASGRVVVASKVGGVPEIVEDGRSGMLVEPGSSDAIADALQRLAQDGALRDMLGKEAGRRVRDQFDISRMVERHAQLYRELLCARADRDH